MAADDARLPGEAPKIGSIFADKYRIERTLGVGGMGYVVAATHIHLHERVAIKMLLPGGASDVNVVERFMREARAAVKIRSEHVARVHDVGMVDGKPFMVMEYLDGTDLAGLLETSGALPIPVAIDYLLEACEAVAEAHAAGIVHRDLKPANLYLAARDGGTKVVKVLDFGISKLSAEGLQNSNTRTSAFMGTPHYMSPEQLRSAKNVDARTDIWALGAILFELVAGRVPFEADSLPELSVLILTADAPDVRTLVPHAPPGVAAAIALCLRRNVQERFPTCAELAAALAPFGSPAAAQSAQHIAMLLGRPLRASFPELATTGPGVDGTTSSRAASSPNFAGVASAATFNATNLPARPPTTSNGGALVALGAALLVAAIGGVLVFKAVGPKTPRDRTAASSIATDAPPSAPSSGVPAREPAALPTANPVVSADVPDAAATAAAQGVAPTSIAPTAPPKRKPEPVQNCNPPYRIDAQGNRVFKAECI